MDKKIRQTIKHTMIAIVISIFIGGTGFAGTMAGHDMADKDRIGDLIHESVVEGYMLAYHFMDLRDQKTDDADKTAMDHSMDKSNDMDSSMDKPHHLMVYIMDKNDTPVLRGKVGFMIKDAEGNAQKAMGMFMSKGFGTTADMKEKGVYKITTKALLGDIKIMDSFEHEIK